MVKTFKPASNSLEKYVDFFYVFSGKRPEKLSYVAFPHVNTAISFFKGAELNRRDHNIDIIASSATDYKVEILGKYTQPVFVNYLGYCDELAIVFKPLGVNYFFEKNMIELTPSYAQELNDHRWLEFSGELFKARTISKRLEMVEKFLLQNYRKVELDKIHLAIHYLDDFESDYTIDQVADLCEMTVKTFQRNFTKHLTCSPIEYKRISRFRHSLKRKLTEKEIRSFTSLSHDTSYYDQSYFIREYRKLTRLSPKHFFDSITRLDENKITWKVM